MNIFCEGYRYDIEVLKNGKGLNRKGKTYRHSVMLPDGSQQELPFPKHYRVTADRFIQWVQFHNGTYALDFEGHRYVPERANSWTLRKCTFRHRVHRADGTTLCAPFWRTRPMSAQAFAFWINLGFPDAARFGRTVLNNTLMARLSKIKEQFNVNDHSIETLMMFHAFETKGS